MNSKLPPKYTFLFLLLFILNTKKGDPAQSESAMLYPAITATSDKASFVSIPPSIVSVTSADKANVKSDLESYQWYENMGFHIRS